MATVRHLGLFPASVDTCPPTYEQSDLNDALHIELETLQEALDVLWRVRQWSIVVQGGFVEEYASSFDTIENDLGLKNSEKSLVCVAPTWGARGQVGPGGIQEGTWTWGTAEPSFSRISTLNGKYYSPMVMSIGGGAIVGFEVGAKQKTGYLSLRYTVPDFYGYNLQLDISPSEYWPYDPGDGLGPIYNSTTGAQLRPFP